MLKMDAELENYTIPADNKVTKQSFAADKMISTQSRLIIR